jgi:hypothetical protein
MLVNNLFGVGTPNQNYGQAAIYNGKQQSGFARDNFYMSGYYTSDLGIFAIRYYWGIVGLAIYEIISIAVLFLFSVSTLSFNAMNLTLCIGKI